MVFVQNSTVHLKPACPSRTGSIGSQPARQLLLCSPGRFMEGFCLWSSLGCGFQRGSSVRPSPVPGQPGWIRRWATLKWESTPGQAPTLDPGLSACRSVPVPLLLPQSRSQPSFRVVALHHLRRSFPFHSLTLCLSFILLPFAFLLQPSTPPPPLLSASSAPPRRRPSSTWTK